MVKVESGREFIEKVEYGKDLLRALENLVRKNEVSAGVLMAIGAVQKASFKYYDQERKEYIKIVINEPLELLSCIGNISSFKGEPLIHCHATFANKNGEVYGGHLDYETIVFSCEVYIKEFKDVKLERKYDQITGLNLLDI